MKIAILDDYQNVALKMADWSALSGRAEMTVFNDHVADPSALVDRLLPYDVVCVMPERTPLPRELLQHLPRLKLIASTGSRNASIDMEAAKELKETSRAWTKFSVITGQEARRVERTYIKDQGKNRSRLGRPIRTNVAS